MFAPPPPAEAFLFFAVWMPMDKTPVNTEAINVGSIFFCGKFGMDPHSSKLKSSRPNQNTKSHKG